MANSSIDIDKLMEAATSGVESIMQKQPDQDLMSTMFVEVDKTIQIIGILAPNKEENIAAINSVLTKFNPERYVLVIEGYGTQFQEAAKRVGYKVRDMAPEDRYEVACLTGVEKGGTARGLTAIIDTDVRTGKRTLRKWESSTAMKGDYVILDW